MNWGIKQSFRSYITGPIAKGKWTTSGAVTQNEGDKGGADFQFHFEVDPSASSVSLGEDGTVTKADIRTKDSTLEFEGHHGALYTKMLSPYVLTEAAQAKAGTSYEGYYVPGKGMTEYTRRTARKKTRSPARIPSLRVMPHGRRTAIRSR